MKFSILLLPLLLLIPACSSDNRPDLRAGPAWTDEALSGLNVSRDLDEEPDVVEYVKCLDKYALGFDDDAFVMDVFTEIAEDNGVAKNQTHINYFISQKQPERLKRLIDTVTEIDEKTAAKVFHYSYSEHCQDNSKSDCTLSEADQEILDLYMNVVIYGNNSCG